MRSKVKIQAQFGKSEIRRKGKRWKLVSGFLFGRYDQGENIFRNYQTHRHQFLPILTIFLFLVSLLDFCFIKHLQFNLFFTYFHSFIYIYLPYFSHLYKQERICLVEKKYIEKIRRWIKICEKWSEKNISGTHPIFT